jgi:hypothetical protein
MFEERYQITGIATVATAKVTNPYGPTYVDSNPRVTVIWNGARMPATNCGSVSTKTRASEEIKFTTMPLVWFFPITAYIDLRYTSVVMAALTRRLNKWVNIFEWKLKSDPVNADRKIATV